MKKFFTLITICICCAISGCAAQSSKIDSASAQLENPLQVPLIGDSPSVHVQTENTTQAREDLDGLLIALLQSEYNMHIADDAQSADYVIELTIDRFNQAGTTSTSASAGDVALPALVGGTLGAQLGSSTNSSDGTLIGAGLGVAAGIGVALLASSGTAYLWEMGVDVNIIDTQNETLTSRINAKAQGEDMDALEAAQALENEVAWSIVRAFKK